MINHRSIRAIAIGLVAAIAASCESPLSDVPISEPSVLRAVAVAERDISTFNTTTRVFLLALRDKHEEWVHLKEGSVTVGGSPMSYNDWGSYVRYDAVRPNTSYTFVVTLSDGSKYSCQVRTPADLNQLTVPADYDRTAPFTVSWKEADGTTQARLDIIGSDTSASFYPQSGLGSYTLQPSAFNIFKASQSLKVMLTVTKPGQVDWHFMSTSSAASSFSIARNCTLR